VFAAKPSLQLAKSTNGTHRRTEKPSYLLPDVERVNDYLFVMILALQLLV